MPKFELFNIIFLILSFCTLGFASSKSNGAKFFNNFHWYGQSSFHINTENLQIYIDPYKLPNDTPEADIIFITHSHQDHFSIQDIDMISNAETIFVAPESCKKSLMSVGISNFQLVNPGDTITINNIPVTVVPAYNIIKTQYHPRENNWVGYIINLNGLKIYHAGDTERIPEMKDIDCDIALIPIGQTYTMSSVEEAVQAIIDINPKVAIPMHYGIYEGTDDDAMEFKKLLDGKIKVLLKTPMGLKK